MITDFRTSIRHIFTDIVWLTTANLLFLRVLPEVPSAADGCMSAVWHPLYLGHSYIYAFACLECLQWIQDALSSASWKKNKKTKHNILPFLLLDSPLKNANILKLFALFLIIACLPCQKNISNFVMRTCKRKCVRVMLRVLSASLLYGGCADNPRMIRQRSCHENAAITICDQQVCQHSHFIRPFHTGLHSNEYYSALSYALQIPANDMLFFFPLWLSLQTLAGPMSFANFRCDLQLFPD